MRRAKTTTKAGTKRRRPATRKKTTRRIGQGALVNRVRRAARTAVKTVGEVVKTTAAKIKKVVT